MSYQHVSLDKSGYMSESEGILFLSFECYVSSRIRFLSADLPLDDLNYWSNRILLASVELPGIEK